MKKLGYFTAAVATFVFMTLHLSHGQTPQSSAAAAGRGDEAMGFDQAKTSHHFKLLPEGGAIEITANDPSDAASRDVIRQHVAKMASMFAQGDFNIPMLVHGQKPPGVDAMTRLKSSLDYAAENLPNGGRLRITTSNPAAQSAVHDFLRFQIREHKSGDSMAEPGSVKRPHPANNLGHDARPGPP